jgi:putative transposase
MMGTMSGPENTAVLAVHSTNSLINQLLDGAYIHDAPTLLAQSGIALRLLKKLVECMLSAELKHHLLVHAGQGTGKSGNYRNGSTPKTVSTPLGALDLAVPRVRFSTFVPCLIPRYQRRLSGFDSNILVLYGRGLSRDSLQSHLLSLYGAQTWSELGGTMTEEVLLHTRKWQEGGLEHSCALVYFDTLQTEWQQNGQTVTVSLLFALGVRADGQRDVFGLWTEDAADTTFWCDVMHDLKGRGLLAPGTIVGSRLTGLQEALAQVYPAAHFKPVR